MMFIDHVYPSRLACTCQLYRWFERFPRRADHTIPRAQSINSLAADRNGNLVVTGMNVQGGFVSKLDPLGAIIFSFANFGAFPAGAAVDANGDIYWIGTGGAPDFPPFPFTKKGLPVPQLGVRTPPFVFKFRDVCGSTISAPEVVGLHTQPTSL